jgi:hypothetical protein
MQNWGKFSMFAIQIARHHIAPNFSKEPHVLARGRSCHNPYFHDDGFIEIALRTIPRLDLSEFANLAEFVVFSLGDRIHPGEIIAGP